MRRRVMEGKYAMLPNLPRPNILKLEDHAYVPLKDIVADFLAHGVNFELIDVGEANPVVSRIVKSCLFNVSCSSIDKEV